MSVTRHYVTDAGGAAWYGEDATVPGAKGCREDNAYSAGQKTAVSDANDATYVECTPAEYPAGHEYDIPISEEGITQFDILARAGNAEYDDHNLYVYNFNTSAYVLLETQGGEEPFDLTGTLTTNLANYVSSGKMRLQVVSAGNASAVIRCYDVYVDVTYGAAAYVPYANLHQMAGGLSALTGGLCR